MSDEPDFSRQSFLGENSQEILANARVFIAGLGGGGSHVALQLAHAGIGNIRLSDPDRMEGSNLNRLVGATQRDVEERTPKVEIARRTILGVRPWINVDVAQKKWQEVDYLIKEAHVVIGCLDGYMQRDFLESAARRYGIPYIDIGMDVTQVAENFFAVAGQMIMTRPGGPCMRCLGFITNDKLSADENRYGDAGFNPQVVWTNGTLASLAVGALIKMITPWYPVDEKYVWLELDGNAQTVVPSQRPHHMPKHDVCPHRGGNDDVGDPFFKLKWQ